MNNGNNSQDPQKNLIKAEQVSGLPHLTESQKTTYADGIQKLWDVIQSRPPDHREYQQAQSKLIEVSQNIKNRYTQWKQSQQQAQQAQQAQRAQQQGGLIQTQQGGQKAVTRPSNQNQQSVQSLGNFIAPQSVPQMAPQVLEHVQRFPYTLPPHIPLGSPEAESWLAEAKLQYGQALQKAEIGNQRLRQLKSIEASHAANNTPFTAEEQQQLNMKQAAFQKTIAEGKRFIENFRQQQAELKSQLERKSGAAGQGAVLNRATQQSLPVASQQSGQPAQPPVNQAPNAQALNPALESTRNQVNAQGRSPLSPSAMGQPNLGHAPPSTQQPLTQPQNATSIHSNTPHQPLGISTTSGAQSNPQHHNSPQTTQPQSSMQPGQPRPLSHQAAMAQAARSYSHPHAQTTPQSASTHAHPHQIGGRDQVNNNAKMPIPKNLNVAQPQPVTMGPARPTFSGGPSNGAMGMMGQPAIQKPPGFVLEGEGERVLSKKKLDELVRQVTGGGEGLGGEGLTAEVEESILQVADDFVDQVITSACRLAKLRHSSTLEIRDIQLILERNYNIRVPGYASDEIRTVRKFQPAPGWSQKMQAINAAKVMGGKTDL
ncbi:MAG: Transcription initiation factor TFIID subunit 12 [Pycnora praestabilis]|nr:MAG: Transcription initiation factor TFIID subunit 12 [Pycnora praestabilis]